MGSGRWRLGSEGRAGGFRPAQSGTDGHLAALAAGVFFDIRFGPT